MSFSRITDCIEICAAPTTHSSSPGCRPGDLRRAAGDVAGDGHVAIRDMVEGQRVGRAAVDQHAPVELTGRNRAGIAIEAAIAGRSVALRHDHLAPGVEVAGDDLQRDFQLLEGLRQELKARHEGFEDHVRVELRRHRAAAQKIGEGERPRPPQPRQHFPALGIEADRGLAHVLAAEAGRVAGADDRADRGAGDQRRLDAELVERLADEDMHHPAGAAAAQGQTDTQTPDMTFPLKRNLAARWRPARNFYEKD